MFAPKKKNKKKGLRFDVYDIMPVSYYSVLRLYSTSVLLYKQTSFLVMFAANLLRH